MRRYEERLICEVGFMPYLGNQGYYGRYKLSCFSSCCNFPQATLSVNVVTAYRPLP